MNETALSEFYYAHIEKIYRFFFYKVLNREIAEDLASQTFLSFVKQQRDKMIENPKAFLYGIANHTFGDYLRKKYKILEVPLDEEISMEEFEPSLHNIRDMLEKVIVQVPEQQRKVLRLRFLDGCTVSEAAEKLSKSETYIMNTQYRGLQTVKKIIGCREDATNIIEKNYELTK